MKSPLAIAGIIVILNLDVVGSNLDCSESMATSMIERSEHLGTQDLDSARNSFYEAIDLFKECNSNEYLIGAYIGLGDAFMNFGQHDSALLYYRKAHEVSSAEDLLQQRIKSMYKLGRTYILSNKPDSAQYYYQRNIDLLEKIESEDDWVLDYKARSYGNMGVIHNNSARYNKAISSFLKVAKIYEAMSNEKGLAFSYNNIGTVYIRIGEDQKSLEYLLKALKLKEKLGLNSGIAETYMNIGGVYYNKNEYDTALFHFRKGLKSAEESNEIRNINSSLLNIASCYSEKLMFDSALYFNMKAIPTCEQNNSLQSLSIIYHNIAEIHNKKGNYKEALKYAEKSMHYGKDFLQESANAILIMSTTKYNNGLFQQAYDDRVKYSRLRDTILNEQKAKQISELMISYETEKKEQEILNLSNENRIKTLELDKSQTNFYLTLTAGIVIILTALMVIQMINHRRLKGEQKNIVLEQKLLRTQMNPHFIFNSLKSIQNFIMKKNTLEAANYLADFSKLMRSILENSRHELISLENEIGILRTYLDLQKLRFDNKFSYSIEIDDEIDLEETRIPPMLSQPFVENAVEHAFTGINYPGKIDIRLTTHDDTLRLEIEDNGLGIDQSLELKRSKLRSRSSLAIQITKERLRNIKLKNISFDLIDLNQRNLNGTLVSFTMPISIN